MSRYFRRWHDIATNNYDSLTDEEKKDWKDFQDQEDQEDQEDQNVPRGTKLEVGQRCRVRNTTFFGRYCGPSKNGKSMFFDDEVGRVYEVDNYKLIEVDYE